MAIRARTTAAAGILVMACCGAASPQSTQTSTASPQSAPSPAPTGDSDELVVEGQRLREKFPVETREVTVVGTVGKSSYADAEMFVRCAFPATVPELRKIIDGQPNGAPARNALDFYIRRNAGCYSGFMGTPPPDVPFYGDCNPAIVEDHDRICRAVYDRGALIERALSDYAPDLAITTVQTMNPAVKDRFMETERRRGKLRLAADRLYFMVVACMVQLQPQRAIRLVHSRHGSREESRERQRMIGLTSPCTGGAKRVSADPIQFRIYVADALYFWAAAARGTDTLLPEG